MQSDVEQLQDTIRTLNSIVKENSLHTDETRMMVKVAAKSLHSISLNLPKELPTNMTGRPGDLWRRGR